jgi:hypothetical protein
MKTTAGESQWLTSFLLHLGWGETWVDGKLFKSRSVQEAACLFHRRGSAAIVEARDLGQQQTDLRPQPGILGHQSPPARLPVADDGLEARQADAPRSAKSARVGGPLAGRHKGQVTAELFVETGRHLALADWVGVHPIQSRTSVQIDVRYLKLRGTYPWLTPAPVPVASQELPFCRTPPWMVATLEWARVGKVVPPSKVSPPPVSDETM